jgi:deazaflavin-dependent oxidoreductase (nitroreductase family)
MTTEGLLDDALRAETECRLVTTGRATGQPREIRIWFAADGNRLFVLAGDRDQAHWVRNIVANPVVHVRLGRRTFEARGRPIEGHADDPVAREAIAAKYGTKWLEKWLRESLPVAIDLDHEVT